MACACFVYVCDVRHLDKRVLCVLLTGIRGDNGQGYPLPPSRVERRLGYPQANFFIFPSNFFIFSTLPHNIIHLPILFVPERFSLPLRVFTYPCIFSWLWGQKTGIFTLSILLCVLLLIILVCFSLFYSLCYVFVLSFVVDAVFFADLPILLPSVGLSLLLRVIIRLGVFRGSETKK